MAQRPAEAIEPPHEERVALAQVIEHARQLGSIVERAAGRVAEDPRASRRGKRVVLKR